jgi:AbrB family looped-hinge helix DNA binding protein
LGCCCQIRDGLPTIAAVPDTVRRLFDDVAPAGIRLVPVKATIDSLGRIVVPKPLRDTLGLIVGTTVDISRYRARLQLVPAGVPPESSRNPA